MEGSLPALALPLSIHPRLHILSCLLLQRWPIRHFDNLPNNQPMSFMAKFLSTAKNVTLSLSTEHEQYSSLEYQQLTVNVILPHGFLGE